MKQFENRILLTGFVAKNTLKVRSFGNYELIRFGLRLSTSSRDSKTQEWTKAYATQFCYGYFPAEMAIGIVAALGEENAVVTVECRLQARHYMDKDGIERESLEFYLLSVRKAEEIAGTDKAESGTACALESNGGPKVPETQCAGKKRAGRPRKTA